MASDIAHVGSEPLIELKSQLTQLSGTLNEIFDMLTREMEEMGTVWQDRLYQDFVEGYKPQINKCKEIADRYNDWCARILEPTIERVQAIENINVGGVSR